MIDVTPFTLWTFSPQLWNTLHCLSCLPLGEPLQLRLPARSLEDSGSEAGQDCQNYISDQKVQRHNGKYISSVDAGLLYDWVKPWIQTWKNTRGDIVGSYSRKRAEEESDQVVWKVESAEESQKGKGGGEYTYGVIEWTLVRHRDCSWKWQLSSSACNTSCL